MANDINDFELDLGQFASKSNEEELPIVYPTKGIEKIIKVVGVEEIVLGEGHTIGKIVIIKVVIGD